VLPFDAHIGAVLDVRLAKEKYDASTHLEIETKKRLLGAIQLKLNPLLTKKGLEPLAESDIQSFSTGLAAHLFEKRQR